MFSKTFASAVLAVSALFGGLVMYVSASPLPVSLEARDVFVPPITYPHAGTVWKAGQTHNVTWSTADAPVNITNKVGSIVLAKGGLMFDNETGGLNDPLASGFDILLGRIEVHVPQVASGDDYQLVLFGDSGNFSPDFTIEA